MNTNSQTFPAATAGITFHDRAESAPIAGRVAIALRHISARGVVLAIAVCLLILVAAGSGAQLSYVSHSSAKSSVVFDRVAHEEGLAQRTNARGVGYSLAAPTGGEGR